MLGRDMEGNGTIFRVIGEEEVVGRVDDVEYDGDDEVRSKVAPAATVERMMMMRRRALLGATHLFSGPVVFGWWRKQKKCDMC